MIVVKFKNIVVSAFMLLTLKSCIEPYEPDVSHYVDVFAVDGEISNLPGPYEVRLTGSYKYDEDSGINVTGAQVKIIENTGFEVVLNETSEGVYRTDSGFRARIGNSYKLQVNYHGEVYETEFETLKAPVPIDSIYWEYENRKHAGVDGIQLLLDTHDPDNNTHYYSWEYEETWKFYVPVFPQNKPEWGKCYKYSNSYDFRIGTSIQKTDDRIEKYPLLFIDSNTNRLRWRYSILVKQYALSEQAYQFYSHLIELNESQGTLFDPVPYSLTGNVRCVTNKEKPVLGYFLVSGVSEKRIFIDNDELPIEYQPVSGFESCVLHFEYINPNQFSSVQDEVGFLMNFVCSSFDFFNLHSGDTLLTLGIQVFPDYFSGSPGLDILYYPVIFDTISFVGIMLSGAPVFVITPCGFFPNVNFTELPFDTENPEQGDTVVITGDTIAMPFQSNWRYFPAVDSLMSSGYFIFEIEDMLTTIVLRCINSAECINCTLTGDNKIPDFWIEDQ